MIKRIEQEEFAPALELVWAVFMQYEAPDYSREGIETFRSSVIQNRDYLSAIAMYGAYEGDETVGVIATRNGGNHIALFFVDGKHHRRGIGRKLFERVCADSTADTVTVNSSPYAADIYRHLGFADNAPEQVTDGMRYIPMTYTK